MSGKMPIKLSQLLKGREQLLQHSRLANCAYAYRLLSEFATRISRAELRGPVTLRSPDPDNEQYWPVLIALDGRQSLIEEYFTDEDLMDLADAVEYVTGETVLDLTFPIEDFGEMFLAPLRTALEHEGVVFDDNAAAPHEHTASDPS